MRPLQGIRVIDLTRILSGPYCTMTLADLGADVIKVEPPAGDETRRWGPPFVRGESTYFLSANRSKRGIVLDLKSAAGARALWDLIATADVVAENLRPGTLERLGCGWDAMHARHPRVILVSISGYGLSGPWASRPGYDLIAQGEGGLMYTTGEPGGPPVKAGFSVADIGAGMWAVIGTLAALRARDLTGTGDHVGTSLLDTMLSWQTYQAEAFLLAGKVPQPMGSAHPSLVPYQAFAASDGYFTLAVGTDAMWQQACAVLDAVGAGHAADQPGDEKSATGSAPRGWYRDARYATNARRVQQRDALIPRLAAIFVTLPRAEWLSRFNAAGIPAGSVNSVAEVYAHPQVAARGMVRQVNHARLGPVPQVALPIEFALAEAAPPSAPPVLGADTVAVLRELDYAADQISATAGQHRDADAAREPDVGDR